MKMSMKALLASTILVAAFNVGRAAAEDFVIGLATAQTGYLAPYDQPALNGLKLKVDEINAAGGLAGKYNVKLVIRDTASDTSATVQAAQELVASGVNILVTPCDADPSIAAGQISQPAQIPTFSFCGSTPTIPAAVGDYMFGIASGDNAQAAVIADYALSLGYKKALLLVSPDSAYTLRLPQYFGEVFTKKGGAVVQEIGFKLGQQDFGAIVTQIKGLDPQPDVIVTSAYEPDFPAFIKQLRSAGVTTPVMGADAIDTPTVLGLGSAVDGVVHSTAGFPTPGSPLAAFYDKYKQATGKEVDTVIVALGYEIGMIIEAAVNAAGAIDGPSVRNAVAAIKDFPGLTGTITYAGTNGMPMRETALTEIRDGKRSLIKVETAALADIPAP